MRKIEVRVKGLFSRRVEYRVMKSDGFAFSDWEVESVHSTEGGAQQEMIVRNAKDARKDLESRYCSGKTIEEMQKDLDERAILVSSIQNGWHFSYGPGESLKISERKSKKRKGKGRK